MKEFPIVYKKAANGKILAFFIKVSARADGSAEIERRWGAMTDRQQIQIDVIKIGKNIGRANATTPFEQAVSDAQSVWNSKKDDGYKTLNELNIVIADSHYSNDCVVTVNKVSGFTLLTALQTTLPKYSTDAAGRIKPQILHHLRLSTYKKGTNEYTKSKQIAYPCIVQPKYDGVCCVASPEQGLITRGGKDRHTPGGAAWKDICPQIYEEIERLNYAYPLHGEVYLHGRTLDEITEATKKANLLSGQLMFVIYDIVDTTRTAEQRIVKLDTLAEILRNNDFQFLTVADWYMAEDELQLIRYEQKFIHNNYEGLVARNFKGMYVPGERSKDVLKLVRFDSSEYTIVDIIPMENEPTHGMFVVNFETASGDLLKVTPGEGFTDAKRKELLKNKKAYIGQQLTIRHRGYTQYGTPRIATGEAIRPIGS